MAQDMAKRLGVTLDVVPTTWGTMMKDLGTRCDMAMGGISVTLDRARQALYSTPYLRDGKAAIVRCADRSSYPTLADIDRPGVRVVVNPDGTNAEFDKANIHHAAVVNYPDNNTIFDQIVANKADVMITDASEIRWQTKANPRLCGESVDHPFTFEQKAYLIPQNDPTMQQWVDEWLNIAQEQRHVRRDQREMDGPGDQRDMRPYPGTPRPSVASTAARTSAAPGRYASSRCGLTGIGWNGAPTRSIGASRSSNPACCTAAAISAPNPPCCTASCATTSRFVLRTER